jgi:L-ascorbate oxidase
MLCEYDFSVEWYATMSKACYNCPFNVTHCSRPDCIAANGVERALIGVNRMMPGPAIEVCKNDIISVYVRNNLHMDESTSIHWHGIRQMGTPYYDGAAMLTQCPIQPHTFFQYKYSNYN